MRNYGLAIKFLAVAVIFGIPYQMIAGDASFGFAVWCAFPGMLTVTLAWAIWKCEPTNVTQIKKEGRQ